MKRFTETTKWDDPWYLDLPAEAKCFWEYLRDKCDNAGVIDISARHVEFSLNGQLTTKELITCIGDRIERLNNGKYFIPSFVTFQFGELKPESNLHKNVITTLKNHGLLDRFMKGSSTLNEGLIKGTSISKGIGKGKVKDGVPTFDEFKSHALSKKKNIDLEHLRLKYDSWIENDWKNGNGKEIKNWKNTLTNTIPYLKTKQQFKAQGHY